VVARLIQLFAELDPEKLLGAGRYSHRCLAITVSVVPYSVACYFFCSNRLCRGWPNQPLMTRS
jgi:hypothetical protein